MPFNANSARTQFKKGSRTGRANLVYKPIGSERLSKDGYVERKVHDGLPFQSRWKQVHRIEWERINGPVPEGHALKCLDGNRQNTAAANWALVSRGMMPRLAGRWSLPYDEAEPEIRPTILAIARLEERARKTRSERSDA